MEVRSLLRCSFSVSGDGEGGACRTAAAEGRGVCARACVCGVVCARSLIAPRACVVLDLCLFGGRKCACAGGMGDVRER